MKITNPKLIEAITHLGTGKVDYIASLDLHFRHTLISAASVAVSADRTVLEGITTSSNGFMALGEELIAVVARWKGAVPPFEIATIADAIAYEKGLKK